MAVPHLIRLALLPLVGLTALDIAVYSGIDFIARSAGDITALAGVALALLLFDLFLAIYAAKSFPLPADRVLLSCYLVAVVWVCSCP